MRNNRATPTAEPRESVPETDAGLPFSPRQLAGGFAIVAALLVLLVRHRHGRKKG
jgi:hypothetical protein